MYSQAGGRPAPGRGGKTQGRYVKGRLPQGVDFAAYPGRSSTPLPTPESKSAERINQLKIWNEAATNDDKRRLQTAKSKQALTATAPANRRTDSFKDARERHSASFQNAEADSRANAPERERDNIFADRSDDDDEDDDDEENDYGSGGAQQAAAAAAPPDAAPPAGPRTLEATPAPVGTRLPSAAPGPRPAPPVATPAQQQKQSNGCCTIQ